MRLTPSKMVPATGLEPVRCYSLEPESSASANSATRASKVQRRQILPPAFRTFKAYSAQYLPHKRFLGEPKLAHRPGFATQRFQTIRGSTSKLSSHSLKVVYLLAMTKGLRSLFLVLALTVSLTRSEPPATRFGFAGFEVFPIDPQVGQLRAADLDGDGLQDLIVVNNSRSKINLLYNQTGRTNLNMIKAVILKREINELPADSRFRIDSIASEKRIASLVVTDLNSDGRPDIVYYGEPKELILQLNQGTNGWSLPKRWAIEDGSLDPYALVAGDLNGDHLTDLLLLGENHIYFFAQTAEHTLAEPEKIPYSGNVKSLQILDIQGDGRDDLMLVNWDNLHPFRFRLQRQNGQLGPEVHFSLPPLRSYLADDLDGDGKAEIVTIAQKSGRAQVYNFTRNPGETLLDSWAQGQFQILPLNRTSKAKRGMAWKDLNGDGLPDLVVAEPESGQLAIHLQKSDGTLAAPEMYPTLTGVSELMVIPWGESGKPAIFLLSTDERQIGITQFDEKGQVPFPKILPLEGRPLALAVGVLVPGSKPVAVTIVDLESKRELQIYHDNGSIQKQKLSETFKSNPSSLTIHDVNQDGLPDLVALIPYEKMKIFLGKSDHTFEELDVAPPGGNNEQPWLTSADVDGDGKPELLLAQKNFLRAVILQQGEQKETNNRPRWTFTVKEQINGAASNSRLIGAAALPHGPKNLPVMFLLDGERKALTVTEKDKAGVWHVLRNIPLPATDFLGLEGMSLAGKEVNAVAFLGLNSVAWLPLSGDVWQFSSLDGYETSIKDGILHDVVSGDLNQDKRKDLVFLETFKSYIDIVTYEAPHQLVPANRWPVFEERTFRGRRADSAEPREALVVDVTGDGKNDLVVIVHDRIIVYPQE
jgi:hypothetical protein